MKNFPTLILLLFVFSLAACSDDKTAENSCKTQLDNSEFQAIINNKGCSNYERASAYLGRAGFSFANFMKDGASNNFSTTLGIDSNWNDNTTGVQNDYTNAICLVGSDNFVNSNCKNNEVKRDTTVARKREDLEISFFGLMGDLILKTYGNLDTNLDGTISSSEQNAFTGLQATSGAGANLSTQANVYQIKTTDGNTYLYDNTNSSAPVCADVSSSNTGVLSSVTTGSATCTGVLSKASKIYPILKVDSITALFSASVDVKSYAPTTFLSAYSTRATALDDDLGELRLKEGSELRKNLKESVDKMDNGATSANSGVCSSIKVFDLVRSIAINAASTTAELSTKNLLSLSQLEKIDPTLSTTGLSSFSGVDITLARLVYKKSDGTYSDLYTDASSAAKTSLQQLRDLSLDSSGNEIKTVAGDQSIDIRELICLSEQ